jgi:hypothetical protein
LQFRYRGSRRESAVAQLFSLGHIERLDFMDTEIQQFQLKLLQALVLLKSQKQKPHRLVLGQHDYAVYERMKQIYTDDGGEGPGNLKVEKVLDQHHFELLP